VIYTRVLTVMINKRIKKFHQAEGSVAITISHNDPTNQTDYIGHAPYCSDCSQGSNLLRSIFWDANKQNLILKLVVKLMVKKGI